MVDKPIRLECLECSPSYLVVYVIGPTGTRVRIAAGKNELEAMRNAATKLRRLAHQADLKTYELRGW